MLMTLREASEQFNCTRASLAMAIKKERIDAIRKGNRWLVDENDLKDYKKTRWDRQYSKYEGKTIYSEDEGFYSITQAIKMMENKFTYHAIYYAIKMGRLPATQKNAAWVLKKDDILNFKNTREKDAPKRIFGKSRCQH